MLLIAVALLCFGVAVFCSVFGSMWYRLFKLLLLLNSCVSFCIDVFGGLVCFIQWCLLVDVLLCLNLLFVLFICCVVLLIVLFLTCFV